MLSITRKLRCICSKFSDAQLMHNADVNDQLIALALYLYIAV